MEDPASQGTQLPSVSGSVEQVSPASQLSLLVQAQPSVPGVQARQVSASQLSPGSQASSAPQGQPSQPVSPHRPSSPQARPPAQLSSASQGQPSVPSGQRQAPSAHTAARP